jgi:hypothetical protein
MSFTANEKSKNTSTEEQKNVGMSSASSNIMVSEQMAFLGFRQLL